MIAQQGVIVELGFRSTLFDFGMSKGANYKWLDDKWKKDPTFPSRVPVVGHGNIAQFLTADLEAYWQRVAIPDQQARQAEAEAEKAAREKALVDNAIADAEYLRERATPQLSPADHLLLYRRARVAHRSSFAEKVLATFGFAPLVNLTGKLNRALDAGISGPTTNDYRESVTAVETLLTSAESALSSAMQYPSNPAVTAALAQLKTAFDQGGEPGEIQTNLRAVYVKVVGILAGAMPAVEEGAVAS